MMRSLTVFLCSTFADLSDERRQVLEGVRRLQLQHDSMEFFGARSGLPIETCLAEVRRSDVLVVIVGHRYGSLVPGLGISFSEAEYREGHRLGKPCLVYLRAEDVPVLPSYVERDPKKLRLLGNWKATLMGRHTVASFSGAQDLALQVTADLSRTIHALEESESRTSAVEPSFSDGIVADIAQEVEKALRSGLSGTMVASTVRRAIADLLAITGHRKPVVFFCYSHRDKQVVRRVVEGLKAAGIEIWFDEVGIRPGESIIESLTAGLNSADYVAFFLSSASTRSKWAQHELNVAISRHVSDPGRPIILPILLDNTKIPALMRSVLYLDLRDGDVEHCIRALIAAIEQHELDRVTTYPTTGAGSSKKRSSRQKRVNGQKM